MARIRSIKPGHCSDRELPNISFGAHLMWVLNWCFSDDLGVFENDPTLIKSNVFPRRKDVKEAHVELWLKNLSDHHFIISFEYKGSNYFINRTFEKHQKIDKPQPSNIPKDVIRRVIDEYSDRIPQLIGDRIGEDRIGEDKDRDRDRIRSGKPPKSETLFRDSEFFDFEKFENCFKGTDYEIFNLKFYYESLLNWSDGKNATKKDWIATVRNFMLKDSKDKKAVLANPNTTSNVTGTTKAAANADRYNDLERRLEATITGNPGSF